MGEVLALLSMMWSCRVQEHPKSFPPPTASTCYFCDLGQITKGPGNITTLTMHPMYDRPGYETRVLTARKLLTSRPVLSLQVTVFERAGKKPPHLPQTSVSRAEEADHVRSEVSLVGGQASRGILTQTPCWLKS